MNQLLLTTKLFIPRARSTLVSRPRLIEQLNAGLRNPLTLISAPAGYGKTTLLADWCLRYGSGYPLAWLSLGPDDNNLGRFLTYLSAALETLDPNIPQKMGSLLYLPQLPPMEELVAALILAASTFPRDFALVLDDYHAITDPAIHAALSYLLDHLPPMMHLVLLTRSDPPLHLARLRVRGDLVEIRAHDLRFNYQESTTYLNDLMDLGLSGDNVTALDQRTEGWIVGLQMAALSMQGKDDASAFIKAFTGSNRFILDFLSEEVIQGQTDDIQDFLLQTSILERFCGPLCDAVLGQVRGSAQVLELLERKNLFLIPLDDARQWYRYHHLFAELLLQNLKRVQPGLVNELYQRAASWFEDNGYLEDAIGYALKAHNYEHATRLIDQVRSIILGRGNIPLMFAWLNVLPETMVRTDPELSLGFASCFTLTGYFELAEKWMQVAEDGFRPLVASDPHAALRSLVIPLYRAAHARYQGDFPRAIALCQHVLDRLPAEEIRYIGVALLFKGHAHYYAGDTRTAEQVFARAIQANLASGHFQAYLNACHHLAQIRVLQGSLHRARETYLQASQMVKDISPPVYGGGEYACLGDLYREWNQFDVAAVEIHKGLEMAEAGDDIFFLIDVYLARLKLAFSQHDWVSAKNYLVKAEGVARRSPDCIEIEHLHAWQARLHLAQGALAEAGQWAEMIESKLKAGEFTSPLTLHHEFTLLTLARIRLAQGEIGQVAAILERVCFESDAAGRYGRLMEAGLLLALAHQAAGDETQAAERFTQVLARAEPEGYVRLLIDEGAPVAKLLYKVNKSAATDIREYAGRLLSAFTVEQVEPSAASKTSLPGVALFEPLSRREIEVLRLMAGGCSNKEIASQLVISLGTVKRHVVHIFQKLRAENRTQAVAIARQLEII